MLVNDPIADMLTRIRNALVAKHDSILVPASNEKKALAKILLDEGFIKSVDYVEEGVQGAIKIGLKYDANRKSVITGLKRFPSPAFAFMRRARSCPRFLAAWALPSFRRPRAS